MLGFLFFYTACEQQNTMSLLTGETMGTTYSIKIVQNTDHIDIESIKIGVDSVLSKNISAVNEVIQIIKSDQQDHPVFRFDEIDIESIEIRVSKDSKYIQKKYSISDIPENISLGAIIRNGKINIPDQHIEIYPDDELLLFSKANKKL